MNGLVAARAQAVLVVDCPSVTEPALAVDQQGFARPLGQKLVGHTIVDIFQNRKSGPGSSSIVGNVFARVALVGIDRQEVDVSRDSYRLGELKQSRHVEIAHGTARADKDDYQQFPGVVRGPVDLA